LPVTRHVYGANVIIFEGIYGLYDQRIVDLMDLKIFVDTDDDIRLARRLKRDIAERGREMKGVLRQYTKFVKPSFDQWIRPTMRNADVIIPRGADNLVAIEVLSKHIARQLYDRGFTIRSKLARMNQLASSREVPTAVEVMPQTSQLILIHSMLRDKDACQDDVIFYTERLSRLVVEAGLSTLEFSEKVVTTPTGDQYKGLTRTDKLCGVSIVRAGLVMERPLRKVCPYVSIGKLLIQTSPTSHEPHLHFCHLPVDIADMKVLLMDATISTGAAMVMALRVLVEHGVSEENITILCLIASPLGLNVVCGAFPRVKVVVSAVDSEVEAETYRMIPGFGNLGDRYFGTE
jgi:uridine kinase